MKPQTPYPATPDGSLPEDYKYSLDPLETLTFAAGRTKRIGLGTSVLDMPFYNPVVLARRLTTLDVLSEGRLRVGLGQGWLKDEFDATGAVFQHRATRADEFIKVVKAIWTTNPVEFRGKFFHVPKSVILPKPAQKPHPPIYLAAFAPTALKRVAILADGWNPVGMPINGMIQTIEALKTMAKGAGRDPSALQVVVRANVSITDKPIEKNRWIFMGLLEQIRTDAEECKKLGATELFFDPAFTSYTSTLERFLTCMELLRTIV
ncbi:MAG: TIGR03619 family F420-dependent LLM class oxidoreductase [Acidobacteria bacterium]|nr:TIGR03619 family F420-dependent LLM class oxidoreductase [Acidobacteriota bacterium]